MVDTVELFISMSSTLYLDNIPDSYEDAAHSGRSFSFWKRHAPARPYPAKAAYANQYFGPYRVGSVVVRAHLPAVDHFSLVENRTLAGDAFE